jgi:hypothetical protein
MIALLINGIGGFIIWLWAQQYRLQVNFELGPEHPQHCELRAHSYRLLSKLLFSALLLPFVSMIPISLFFRLPEIGQLIGMVCILAPIIGIIVLLRRYTQNYSRYYTALPYEEQQQHIKQIIRETIIDWIAWINAIAIECFLFLTLSNTRVLEKNLYYQAMFAAFIVLVVWFFANIRKWQLMGRWRRIMVNAKS